MDLGQKAGKNLDWASLATNSNSPRLDLAKHFL